MQINKAKRLVNASTVSKKQSVEPAEASQKVVKSAIDKLGALIACCETPEDKKAIQGAIANMSVVLLELKK